MADTVADPAPPPCMSWAKDAAKEYLRIVDAIEEDCKSLFVTLMDSPRLRDFEEFDPPLSVSDFVFFIFDAKAYKCADAVLRGETSPVIDKYFGLPRRDGWTALHQAALFPNYVMLKKLIDSGLFDPNVRSDMPEDELLSEDEYLPLKQALPLNVVLTRLRSNSPDHSSAASLLAHIYSKMDGVLDSIRLLALNTREFQQEFFNYAKQGKMIEVAGLLLPAGDKLFPLSIPEREAPFNSFKEIKDFLQSNIGCSSTVSNDDEFAEWTGTLNLLDIYDKIANQLFACAVIKENRRTGMEVATLLQAHGFDDVKIRDNNLRLDRSDNSSFNLPSEISKLFPIQNMYSSNWMNQESGQSSMPIKHEPCSQSFVRNMCTLNSSRTPPLKSLNASTTPMKSFNAMRHVIFNKRLPFFMRILTRGLR